MDKQYTLPDLPYDYAALEPHYSMTERGGFFHRCGGISRCRGCQQHRIGAWYGKPEQLGIHGIGSP